MVLKRFIVCCTSLHSDINPTLRDGLDALRIDPDVTYEIAKAFLLVYQKIAQNLDVTSSNLHQSLNHFNAYSTPEMFEDNEEYGVFPLPNSVWGSVKFAEKYVEHKLNLKSGADVLFYNNRTRGSKLEAWGNEKALQTISEIVEKISKLYKSKLDSGAEQGHVIVNEAYSVIFQGGCNESELLFKRYSGVHHEIHKNKPMYLPIIKYVNAKENTLLKDFEDKFIQQWNILKSEYIDLFHGELIMTVSFGMFYVMNVHHDEQINVRELNRLFATIPQRKEEQRRMMKKKKNKDVTYTSSFHPVVNCSTDRIRYILENLGFSYLDMETDVSIKIAGKAHDECHFRNNGDLWNMNFPNIKWSMVTVVPESTQNKSQLTNIRFRLQSFRKLDRKVVGIMEEYKPLVERRGMLKATQDGYMLDVFFKVKYIIYAREKVIEVYRKHDNDLSRSLVVEVSRDKELKPNTGKTELQRSTSSGVEVNFIPDLPPLESTNEEIKRYSRYILKEALRLANQFDVS